MIALIGVLVSLFTAAPALEASQQTAYTENFSLGPMRVTHEQLAAAVSRVHNLLRAANPDSLLSFSSEGLTVSNGKAAITLAGDYSVAALAAAPSAAYDVSFSFVGKPDLPVSYVTIDLADYTRRVTIRGTSRDQVAALAAALRDSLGNGTAWVGGSRLRLMLGMLVLLLPPLLMMLRETSGLPDFKYTYLPLLLLPALLVFVPPWDRILPGMVLLAPGAGFLVRYAPHMTFLGFVVSLIGVALAVGGRMLAARPNRGMKPDSAAGAPPTG